MSPERRAAEFHAFYLRERIENQHTYYRRRRDDYSRAHRQAVVARNLLLLGAAISAPLGQLLGGGSAPVWPAVVAAALAALAAALTGFEALIDYVRLATLYDDTANDLERAAIAWERRRAPEEQATGVAEVERILRTEHGRWGQFVVDVGRVAESGGTAAPGGSPPGPGRTGSPDAGAR